MKSIILGLLFIFTTSTIIAQNIEVKDETKTTITTIKDSKGESTIVETEETKEVQELEIMNPNSPSINKDVKPSPVNVTTTKAISVDGKTKSISIDQSSYYELDGTKYKIKSDGKGYLMIDTKNNAAIGLLRKTSNDSYIITNKNKVSVGHFDDKGNLMIETYDPKTDSMIKEEYKVNR